MDEARGQGGRSAELIDTANSVFLEELREEVRSETASGAGEDDQVGQEQASEANIAVEAQHVPLDELLNLRLSLADVLAGVGGVAAVSLLHALHRLSGLCDGLELIQCHLDADVMGWRVILATFGTSGEPRSCPRTDGSTPDCASI